jgi:serine-type D-Ala-D-Ala carboxypeptidase
LNRPEDADVLVHHLLTHSAGWESAQQSHRLEAFLASGQMTAPPPGRDFITHVFLSMALDPIRVAPIGAEMQYDNGPYELLAEIVRRETGGSLDAAMRSRIFEPLRMTRSAGVVDDGLRPHLVTRAEGLPFGPDAAVAFEGDLWESSDSGAAAVHCSAPDLATFGQMILNGGTIGDARVLAPSTVTSMVTNQIPGLPAQFHTGTIPEASWGYGFSVVQAQRFAYFTGGLMPFGSVLHPGAGGINYWIDFAHEIVGVFFEVITEIDEFLTPVSGVGHRFADVIVGAVRE